MSEQIKILCVDDERNVLKALRRLFMEEENYEILVAESGEEGLEILTRDSNIRMVISDYRMPRMGGDEFLRQVNEKWPETVRIVLSGYADTTAVVEAINKGQIYKFIPKPWNDEDLLTTVAVALDHQELNWQVKKMAAELQQKNTELQEINNNLEHLVAKRTEALEIRNHVLQISQGILDILPVVIFGIDPEQVIVHCNQYARELFWGEGLGPLGNTRQEVFPPEVNALIDRLETEVHPRAMVAVQGKKYRGEVKRLHETLSEGVILVLIPECEDQC